jgi:hypothetical protein
MVKAGRASRSSAGAPGQGTGPSMVGAAAAAAAAAARGGGSGRRAREAAAARAASGGDMLALLLRRVSEGAPRLAALRTRWRIGGRLCDWRRSGFRRAAGRDGVVLSPHHSVVATRSLCHFVSLSRGATLNRSEWMPTGRDVSRCDDKWSGSSGRQGGRGGGGVEEGAEQRRRQAAPKRGGRDARACGAGGRASWRQFCFPLYTRRFTPSLIPSRLPLLPHHPSASRSPPRWPRASWPSPPRPRARRRVPALPLDPA